MALFLPYQKKWFDDQSLLKIWNKSRQIGYTEVSGFEAVNEAFFENTNVLLASSSMRQAKLLMDRVEKYIEVVGAMSGKPLKLLVNQQTQKTFSNKKSIYCLPSNPKTVRGFFGNVKIDEFALHKNQKEIYRALYPTITRGFRISIGSTPLGMNDMFYEIFSNTKLYGSYSRHMTTIFDAVREGMLVDIEKLREGIDDDSFRQEFCCEFIDDTATYFPLNVINIEDYDISILPNDSPNFMGVDVGRVKELTCIVIVKKVVTKYYLVHFEIYRNTEFSEQRDYIQRLYNTYDCVAGQIDMTGLGMQLAEELNKWNEMIKGVMFNNEIKHRLVTGVKKLFLSKNLSIYDDRDLITDIHAIQREVSKSSNVKFGSNPDVRGHADRFWALALAVDCALRELPIETYVTRY